MRRSVIKIKQPDKMNQEAEKEMRNHGFIKCLAASLMLKHAHGAEPPSLGLNG